MGQPCSSQEMFLTRILENDDSTVSFMLQIFKSRHVLKPVDNTASYCGADKVSKS